MEGRDVAESKQPFGMAPQLAQIEFIHETDGSVAAPVADYRLDGRIMEGPENVRHALIRSACVFAEILLSHIRPDHRLVAPGTDDRRGAVDLSHRCAVGRREESDLVSRRKKRRGHTLELHWSNPYRLLGAGESD